MERYYKSLDLPLAVGLFGVFEHVTGSQQLVASSALQAAVVLIYFSHHI
jgi:hypothetical protein